MSLLELFCFQTGICECWSPHWHFLCGPVSKIAMKCCQKETSSELACEGQTHKAGMWEKIENLLTALHHKINSVCQTEWFQYWNLSHPAARQGYLKIPRWREATRWLKNVFWCWHIVCLFPARAYSGSSVWQPAEAAPQPHRLHRVSAAGSGEGLPADAVPRCWHEREAGFLRQPAWSPHTGEGAGCLCNGV